MTEVSPSIPGTAQPVEGLDIEALRHAIQEEYAAVATDPERGFHFHTGRSLARLLGYEDRWLDGVPGGTIASFAGTGNPFSLGELSADERVVDVGCGAGIDSIIAARMVAPGGHVVGVDMTPPMLDRARASAREAGIANLDLRLGFAEQLPVGDAWADVVISNGVMNLFPDKLAGLQEMSRVLKPGGRLQVGDILVSKTVSQKDKRNVDLWKGWIAGALLEAELKATVVAAGFVGFEITRRADVFGGAPQASSAVQFGTVGINFRARKASTSGEWNAAIAELSCAVAWR